MRSGGHYFNYWPQNQMTKLATLEQFKCVLMFCLWDWAVGPMHVNATANRQLATT